METQGYRFELATEENPVIIKVIGVGGMGGNAVKHMDKMKMKDVSFAVCNTDRQALMNNPVKVKLQLGDGLGAGTESKAGEMAARASIDEIRNLLTPPTKMVFITAGMGGGTGTGAAPVVAEVAREMGLLTVAVVTAPYWYEGTDKKNQAREGIEKLKESCDTVLVVLNDKLAELYSDLAWTDAYAHADDVLANAVRSIAEIITTQGDINADFADVKKVLQGAGQSVMGSAEAAGEDRAIRSIEAALNSPLLNDHNIQGAKRILLTISSSQEHAMRLREQTDISVHVANKIQHEADMFKFGAITDNNLGDKLRVTIIAAGFDGSESIGGLAGQKPSSKQTGTFKPETLGDPKTGIPIDKKEPSAGAMPVLAGDEGDGGEEPRVEDKTNTRSGGGKISFDEPPTEENASSVPMRREEPEDAYPFEDIRPDDSDMIKRLVERFHKNQYLASDLDKPTYERNKTVLYSMPMLSQDDFIRSNLNA